MLTTLLFLSFTAFQTTLQLPTTARRRFQPPPLPSYLPLPSYYPFLSRHLEDHPAFVARFSRRFSHLPSFPQRSRSRFPSSAVTSLCPPSALSVYTPTMPHLPKFKFRKKQSSDGLQLRPSSPDWVLAGDSRQPGEVNAAPQKKGERPMFFHYHFSDPKAHEPQART